VVQRTHAGRGGVEVSSGRKSDWELTAEAFERLLSLMDPDRERAGEKYELIRRKLVFFFETRGSESPAEHADETLNRAARKVAEGEPVEDINRYLYGVARLLLLELGRARERGPLPLDSVAPPGTLSADEHEEEARERAERERRFECFEGCLGGLPPESRAFIVDYYREERGEKIRGRKRQAGEMGVSLNALRLRASRIRTALERCVNECLGGAAEK
jgi:DNA-directed RNA polymerase specialized sigma24 family protein